MANKRISSCNCTSGTAETKAELITVPNTTWLRKTDRATAAREIPVTATTLILALNIAKAGPVTGPSAAMLFQCQPSITYLFDGKNSTPSMYVWAGVGRLGSDCTTLRSNHFT